MKDKVDPALFEILGDLERVVEVIVTLTNGASIDELSALKMFHITRELRFINAVSGRIRVEDVLPLSRSRIIERIELDKKATIAM